MARLVAAIPPLTLVQSFELLTRQRRGRLSNGQRQTESPPYQAPAPTVITADSPTVTAAAPTASRSGIVSKTQEIHQQHLRDVPNSCTDESPFHIETM